MVQQTIAQRRKSFFQLAGHEGCFKLGTRPDTILKKATGNEEQCFSELSNDSLSTFVPKLVRAVDQDGDRYLEMQDLLSLFDNVSVMDVKMGCRTYRETELNIALQENKLRHDMYNKMVEIDESEPTREEKEVKAVSKPRYMVWRESISSTASLGFRIEGMRLADGPVDKDFKTTKLEEDITKQLFRFVSKSDILAKYLKRLDDLSRALEKSKFFSSHELIGSSLLFVHSDTDASVWLIDFAKTHPLPENTKITHKKRWELGNHEDGFLIGLNNLIRIFKSMNQRTTITTDVLSYKQILRKGQKVGNSPILTKTNVIDNHSTTDAKLKTVAVSRSRRFVRNVLTCTP